MMDVWAEEPFLGALELIAEGISAVSGFQLTMIQIADESGHLRGAAVGGPGKGDIPELSSHVDKVQQANERAEHLGHLRFLSHDNLGPLTLEFVPDIEVSDQEGAWHPSDVLFSPVVDDTGRIRGVWFLDLPADGMRPDAAKIDAINQQAAYVQRAILSAVEHRELSQRVRFIEAAKGVIRNLSTEGDVAAVLAAAQTPLARGMGVHRTWILTIDESGALRPQIYDRDGTEIPIPENIGTVPAVVVRAMWESGEDYVITREHKDTLPYLTEAQRDAVIERLESHGWESVLITPIGLGAEILGLLVMTKQEGDDDWTALERATAREICHDIGRALVNTRNRELQQLLVAQLRQLHDYKSELVAMVAHELRSPLTSILGRLELADEADLDPLTAKTLAVVGRSAEKMQRLVEDLLILAESERASDDAVRERLDLAELINQSIDELSNAARTGEIALSTALPPHPAWVMAPPGAIDGALINLIGNAVKYTDPGGSVVVSLSSDQLDEARWQVRVRDTGIGISADDLPHLFEDFYRSADPAARERHGNGLGLAIVKRVAESLGGHLSVDSVLGEGTTITLTVPAAPDGADELGSELQVRGQGT